MPLRVQAPRLVHPAGHVGIRGQHSQRVDVLGHGDLPFSALQSSLQERSQDKAQGTLRQERDLRRQGSLQVMAPSLLPQILAEWRAGGAGRGGALLRSALSVFQGARACRSLAEKGEA